MDYVICACPRTGSHLLAEALVAVGAGRPREYLNPMMSQGDALVPRPRFLDPDPVAYFERTRGEATVDGIFGIKVHYPQLRVFDGGADVLVRLLPGARYLSVTRRRTLRQAVSYAKATQSRVWRTGLRASAGDRLPGGAEVPAGMKIYLSPYVSQRSSAAFVEAERFDPDRFLPDRDVDPWRYFPFGAGTRSCLGERLARRIGATVLSSLARRARLAPLVARPPRPLGHVTLRPARPIRVAVASRGG